jgi:hypothetical protein
MQGANPVLRIQNVQSVFEPDRRRVFWRNPRYANPAGLYLHTLKGAHDAWTVRSHVATARSRNRNVHSAIIRANYIISPPMCEICVTRLRWPRASISGNLDRLRFQAIRHSDSLRRDTLPRSLSSESKGFNCAAGKFLPRLLRLPRLFLHLAL